MLPGLRTVLRCSFGAPANNQGSAPNVVPPKEFARCTAGHQTTARTSNAQY
jgi:hypothetical protein